LDNSNQVAAYTYNGAGQRIKKVTQTETRIFHYDRKGHLIAETNQTGQAIAEYIYLGDQLLAMIKPGESVYYYHNDHLGTPQVLTDDSQTIAWKAVYTPFGEAVPSIQTVDNPFRFPGQYYDQETGLHYNYFRYYNPQTGRYITPDPIGLEGGINLFVYVAGNPVNLHDYFGLVTWPSGYKYVPPGGEYGAKRRGGKEHNGLDIRNYLYMTVYSSDSGTVIGVWFDEKSGGGSSILILGDDGSVYGYAHTGSFVVLGQRVEEGQAIGYSDGSGKLEAPHLHYIYRPPCSKKNVNPKHHLEKAVMPKSQEVY
jgi:RHS repeat-associated protein